ncbi:MAG: hypothetical protein HY886_01320 [Deltaproteobacteria bacterium]|nr:hypothetical protein [Deltaproteobacteria bacterium]
MFKSSYMSLVALLITAFIISGCASMQAAREADELAAAGEWDEAVLRYRDAYRESPHNLEYKMGYTRARQEAARIHYNRGMDSLGKSNHDMAALEFQAALIMDPAYDRAQAALKKTRRLMDSLYYYAKGLESLKKGDESGAKTAFKKAVDLDRDNLAAAEGLEKLGKQQKVVMDGYELDIKSAAPITLEFKDAPVKKVFEVLSRLSGINFVFDSDMRDEKTSIFIKGATFQQAVELLLVTNKLGRKVANESSIIIYPATPQKISQYDELMIKVFYLTNSDAKKTANLLKTMIKARDIAVQEELNAIVVRSKPDALDLAQKIIAATDLADSEVMLEVTIMEIDRNKASNLGIDFSPDAVTAAIPTSAGTISLRNLGSLSSGDLLIGLPSAALNIKRQDLDANILANPRIRVRNNAKAKIHVGERVPIITTTVNQGVSTENVQYTDVGLKLSVEPAIRHNDDVDIKLGLEVSSLGTKTTTTNGSVVYQIGTRNTETLLRLHDGQTQIIGGLMNDEERTTTAKIPLFGDVPVIGRLFSNVDSSKVKTEILMSITPHILRKLELPEEASSGFFSGRDDSPSVKPLLEGFFPEAIERHGAVKDVSPAVGQESPQTMPYPIPPPPPPILPDAVPAR